MLSIIQRKIYLKSLGYYKGDMKEAILALQKDYFKNKEDIDGIYGNNTDILLYNAYVVKKYCKNFKLSEFDCNCKGKMCTGYPVRLDVNMLKALQRVRNRFGQPITITCGARCKKYNSSIPGSVPYSYHLKGKAVDFTMSKCKTIAGRKEVMKYIKNLPKFKYTYCNEGDKPYMGNSVHMEFK